MIRMIFPGITAAVVLYLFFKKKITRGIFVVCLAGTAIAAALLLSEIEEGGRRKITSIDRASEDDALTEVPLEVQTEDGKTHDVSIRIPEKRYTEEEIQELLRQKADELDDLILGENQSFDRIEWNLELPTAFDDSPVTCDWNSDHPEIVAWDGELGTDINADGVPVTVTGTLSLNGETQEYQKRMRVYPSREEGTFAEKLQKESEELNETAENDKEYRLPEEVDGKKISWYQNAEQRGGPLCLVILFAAVFSVIANHKKEQEKEEKRRQQLNKEYPDLVSKIQLLTAAGMSLRRCMGRLAGEYPEVKQCWYEMENGVTEQEAYAHFGERCGTPEYRKLALLLAQSQKKGGRQLSQLLEQEVQEAFETKKRSARAEGEKAQIRMILPMVMMLAVVMIVIMVPAMLAF